VERLQAQVQKLQQEMDSQNALSRTYQQQPSARIVSEVGEARWQALEKERDDALLEVQQMRNLVRSSRKAPTVASSVSVIPERATVPTAERPQGSPTRPRIEPNASLDEVHVRAVAAPRRPKGMPAAEYLKLYHGATRIPTAQEEDASISRPFRV